MNTLATTRLQRGNTLLIALLLLIALTMLTLSNMRGVSLESRITANRVEASRLQNLADAALREGEFRFYGPAHLREKLEPKKANCAKNNKLLRSGNNKPCLLEEMTDSELDEFFSQPLSFLRDNSYGNKYSKQTGQDTNDLADDSTAEIAWMPYRGLDAKNKLVTNDKTGHAYWNSYRVISGSSENEAVNPEYGAALEGKGTFFFLINGQGDDQIATQSTIAVIYTGLNN
ncbi:MAG: pilus assembly protein PilX [Gammaproteobacteria bacterium]|nr:pilus assembly protein PilX [Gammaproteobacteria bacterium]